MNDPTNVPRTMSTQHPDNVTIPFFAEHTIMTGDDEVQEAYYVYSHLNVGEQLWDIEGKEVDNYVVQKLLSRYGSYFHEHVLGNEKWLTVRVPNPEIEKHEAKLLPEIVHSIPRNHDTASKFYKRDVTPIFELVIPMCESDRPLILLHDYYTRFVHDAQQVSLRGVSMAEWLGEFKPDSIVVTPLFETKDAILNADKIVEKYLSQIKTPAYQRVWFARSDPALNYGSVAAILLVKIGLQRLHTLETKIGVPLLPIIGMGSSPFRGNLRPATTKQILLGYPSVQTFTLQSAFKYDHPIKEVMAAVDYINSTKRGLPLPVDEDLLLRYIDTIEHDYAQTIAELAPLITQVAKHIPGRRKRKLHTGLFGYSRSAGAISLPRAITFCAALYSIGLPPEIFGLSTLTRHDVEIIKKYYANFDYDMTESLRYLNRGNLAFLPTATRQRIERALKLFPCTPDAAHEELTTRIFAAIRAGDHGVNELVIRAAHLRGYLG